MSVTTALTWPEMVERDLRLALIEDIACKMRAISRTPRDRELDYITVKRLGMNVVGMFSDSKDPWMKSGEAWSVFIAQMCQELNR